MREPRRTGPTSGTSARIRWPNEPLTASPRACWASRIEPARSCIRGTIWTADRTTNARRWLAPRRDERLEQVVGERREQEGHQGQEGDDDRAPPR